MTRLAFAPHIPLWLLGLLAALALLITLYGFYARARGAWARGLAFAILIFALAGPILVKEIHAPLPDVMAVVVDRSQSMRLGTRQAEAEAALAQIRRHLAGEPNLIVREASVATTSNGENNGTQAFAALDSLIGYLPT